MDWTNDLEISTKKLQLKPTIRDKNYLQQLIPRLGRRAGHNATQEDTKSSEDLDSHGSLSSGASVRAGAPIAPPRTRKTGWGDDLKSAKTRSGSIIEQEKFRKASKDEVHEDIPVIPDIEDIQEDNVFSEIASGPSVGINRVAAYQELDTDLLKNASFAFLDDINLSLLTAKMFTEALVGEPDEIWNWDQLFTQVSSELNIEAEKKTCT